MANDCAPITKMSPVWCLKENQPLIYLELRTWWCKIFSFGHWHTWTLELNDEKRQTFRRETQQVLTMLLLRTAGTGVITLNRCSLGFTCFFVFPIYANIHTMYVEYIRSSRIFSCIQLRCCLGIRYLAQEHIGCDDSYCCSFIVCKVTAGRPSQRSHGPG